jgi:hypothetical protein
MAQHFGKGCGKTHKFCFGKCQSEQPKAAFEQASAQVRDSEWSKCASKQPLCIACKTSGEKRRGYVKPTAAAPQPSQSPLIPGQARWQRARTPRRRHRLASDDFCS